MITFSNILIAFGIFYTVGGFIYAGANAMIDLNWIVKLYREYFS